MNFQVSDTDLQTKRIRRTALRHAWLSFTLGAVIIAASINVVSAWLNSGPIRPAYLITMDSRTLVVALYTECVQNEQAVLLTPSDDDAAEIRNHIHAMARRDRGQNLDCPNGRSSGRRSTQRHALDAARQDHAGHTFAADLRLTGQLARPTYQCRATGSGT